MKKNRKFLKILPILLVFIFIIGFTVIKNTSAQIDEGFGVGLVDNIESLNAEGRGLINCDPYSTDPNLQCNMKNALNLLKSLSKLALYLVIIILFIVLVTSGIGYLFNKTKSDYLTKMKKYITNAVISLGIIVLAIGLTLGILAATGFNSEIMDKLKTMLVNNDITLISKASAQSFSDVSTIGKGFYINLFPGESLGTILLKLIRVTIVYIVAPLSVVAVIYTGFLFVKAQGKSNELIKAKDFATKVAIVIGISAAAIIIVTTVLNTLERIETKVKERTSLQYSSPIKVLVKK